MYGVYVGFLIQVMVKMTERQRDGTWRNTAVVSVLKEARTHTLGMHIDQRQATVVEGGALRQILDVCNRKTIYEGGGRHRELWWQKMASRKQLRKTLEDISEAAREWRWESGRCGKGGGGGGVADYNSRNKLPRYSGMDTGNALVG